VRVVKFSGWADYYKEIKKKVDLHLTGKTGRDVVGAIGLLDLYGPTFYPPDKTSREERYSWAKSHVESIVDNNRFRQHFAVHETEAWLLAEPQIHPAPVARSLEKSTIGPEAVDFECPPARWLDRLYKQHLQRSYGKITDGVRLFGKLQPDVARERCPYFAALLDDLVAFASNAT